MTWLHQHRRVAIIITVLFVFGALTVGRAAFAFRDKNVVFDGVRIGALDAGGMTRDAVRDQLRAFQNTLATQGLSFVYQDGDDGERRAVIYPMVFKSDGSDSRVFADIDVEATTDIVWSAGRGGSWGRQVLERLRIMGYAYRVPAVVAIDEQTFQDVLHANIERDERPARDAHLVYDTGAFRVETEQTGVVYTVDAAIARARTQLAMLSSAPITIERKVDTPRITRADIEPFLSHLSPLVNSGDVVLTREDPQSKETRTWKWEKERIGPALQVQKDENGATRLGLEAAAFGAWLKETVTPDVEVEARDAKFRIEGDRVMEFQSSRAGVTIDAPGVERAVADALGRRFAALRAGQTVTSTEKITLAVAVVEPKIKTGDVNNLGIKELLGIGTSSWKGSPSNRIKNIRNGMNKLNGILIKPDEEFSLLAALRPFTIEGGYLPELVIKGDKIEPEIGGGLCQIGTTSFRMAMNSGMPITQRVNHGLVVTYYNDPSNGNPGTDATIYDPAPDFRFKNDTGHYLLWTTHMDTTNSKLEFSLWGTSDGRKGSYSAPVVHGWVATGPMKEIETLELPVGKRKCQSRHPGASASFTYTVELPDGTKKDTLYKSYYRPLPEICEVGVEKLSEEAADTAVVPSEDTGEQPAVGAIPIPFADVVE